MNPQLRNRTICVVTLVILLMPLTSTRAQPFKPVIPNLTPFPDSSGFLQTFNRNGDIDLTGPFSRVLGLTAEAAGPAISQAMR